MPYVASPLIINPESGTIDRSFKNGAIRRNVGHVAKSGHVQIRVGGRLCLVHRLIWEHVHGEIPDGMVIDHINRVPSDNRISNLRMVTQVENMQNTEGPRADNKSSRIKGVTFDKRRNKWVAQIFEKGVHRHLGQWETKEEAADAYASGAAKYHAHNPSAKSS